MLCLYTGFGDVVMAMQKKPDLHRLENSCAVLDGRDAKLLNWITDSGLACLIADNYAVEGLPARESDSGPVERSEEHTSELQSLMRISYAVFCLKQKNKT